MGATKKITSKVGKRNIEAAKSAPSSDKPADLTIEIIKKNEVVENEQDAEFGDNITQGVTDYE